MLPLNRYWLAARIKKEILGFARAFEEQSRTRNLHTGMRKDSSAQSCLNLQLPGQDEKYASTYNEIIRHISQDEGDPILAEAKERLINVLNYTIPQAKQFASVTNTYKLVESTEGLSKGNIRLANILGHCVAMKIASHDLQNDIIEEEETRNNLPCWHTLDNIGLSAINDNLMIENALIDVIQHFFSDHPYHFDILDFIQELSYRAAAGQLAYVMSTDDGFPKFESFTRERFEFLAEYRTTTIYYELPVKLGMYLAGMRDAEVFKRVSSVATKIGLIFAAQSDLQSSFSTPNIVRKSTNIRNGRCTWLAVEALQRGTPAQKQIFMENYGRSSAKSIQTIHDLYKKLKLDRLYTNLERETVQLIEEEVKDISGVVPKNVFGDLLNFLIGHNRF